MKQFLVVFKHEYLNFVRNKSFIIVSAIAIIAVLALTTIPRFQAAFDSSGDATTSSNSKIVLVDQAGYGDNLTALMEAYFSDSQIVVSDLDLDGVKQAVKDGDYEIGFIVTDFDSYQYIVDSQSLSDTSNAMMNQLIHVAYQSYLMQENGLTAQQASGILSAAVSSEVVEIGVDQAQNFFFTYAMTMFLYITIMIYGQLISTNVASEKTSRAMEMLITCAKPRALMFGKIVASGMAGLSQIALIIATGYLGYLVNADYLEAGSFLSVLNVSSTTLVFGILFFLLGYFLYAFLYGAVGSTVSKIEDISPSVMPITFLFVAGFMITIMSTTSGSVDSIALVAASFFPFFAPLAMMARIGMSAVPAYQIAISVGLLMATTVLIGLFAAKVYRMGSMHYGNRMKLRDIFKAIKN